MVLPNLSPNTNSNVFYNLIVLIALMKSTRSCTIHLIPKYVCRIIGYLIPLEHLQLTFFVWASKNCTDVLVVPQWREAFMEENKGSKKEWNVGFGGFAKKKDIGNIKWVFTIKYKA